MASEASASPVSFGLAVRVAAQERVADGGLGVHAEAAVVAVGAAEAEGGHAQHDDAGVDLAEGLVADAGAGHRLGHVVLDEDIATRNEAVDGLAALGGHDVAGHGALVAGADVEAGAAVPGVVAGVEVGVGAEGLALLGDPLGLLLRERPLGAPGSGLDAVDGLDADDLGAPVGKQLADVRAGPHDRDLGDTDPFEGEAAGGEGTGGGGSVGGRVAKGSSPSCSPRRGARRAGWRGVADMTKGRLG